MGENRLPPGVTLRVTLLDRPDIRIHPPCAPRRRAAASATGGGNTATPTTRTSACRAGLSCPAATVIATTFVFTTKDGAEVPALPAPQQVGGEATPGAASAEDQVILGLEPVRL